MFSQFVFVLEVNNQATLSLFGANEISVLIELTLGHPRYLLTDVPPQPNSPPDNVFRLDRAPKGLMARKWGFGPQLYSTE